MSEYPTAEEELKTMTKRFWAQVEVTEKVVKDRNEAKAILETVCFHLRRNDHVTPPTGATCTNQMIDRIERFLLENEKSPSVGATDKDNDT
jgi:hypothetical protein